MRKKSKSESIEIICGLDSTEHLLRQLESLKKDGSIRSYKLSKKSGFGPLDANIVEFLIIFGADLTAALVTTLFVKIWDRSPEKKHYPTYETRRKMIESLLEDHEPLALIEIHDTPRRSAYIYDTTDGRFRCTCSANGVHVEEL